MQITLPKPGELDDAKSMLAKKSEEAKPQLTALQQIQDTLGMGDASSSDGTEAEALNAKLKEVVGEFGNLSTAVAGLITIFNKVSGSENGRGTA